MKIIYIALLGLLFYSSDVVAQDARLQKAEAWFANLKSAKSQFQQIDHQGNVMRGTFYINRPGRLRFEYDAPTRDYIVADGFQIHFYDAESDQYNSGPIGATLADFILRDDISFQNDTVTVDNIDETDTTTNITVYQTDQAGMGTLTLSFNKAPYALKSWTIEDAQGLTTSVVLRNFDRTAKIDPAIFKVDNRNLNQ